MPTTVVSGATLSTDKGGSLQIPADERVESPSGAAIRPYGVGFGPLEVTAYPDTTATITGLSYGTDALVGDKWFDDSAESQDSGWFGAALPGLLAGVPAGAAAGDDDSTDTDLRRREFLVGAATALTVSGAMTQSAAALDETATRARIQLDANPGGLRVRVLDVLEQYLPTGVQYHLSVDGVAYDSVVGGTLDDYADVPPTVSGEVVVGQDVSLLSKIRAILGAKAVTYDGITLAKDPADAPQGTKLTVTTHEIIATHLQKSKHSTLTIGGESIPHYSESATSPRGWYAVRDGAVVYQVGSDPPSGTTASLTIHASLPDELSDDAGRVI